MVALFPINTVVCTFTGAVCSSPQGNHPDALRVPHRTGDNAHWRVSVPVSQDDFLRGLQLPVALSASGIVQHDHKLRFGRGLNALLNLISGREQVAQADGGKVMGQRRAQQ